MTLKMAINNASQNFGIIFTGICGNLECSKVFFTTTAPWIKSKVHLTDYRCSKVCGRTKGWTLNSYGYIGRHINKKYIQQHRHIMEQKLKRKLRKFETVHHKNGIRSDNRPSNLELWTKRQPTGQRVSDLIKFVKKYYL